MKIKALLYCTKGKPYLRKLDNYFLDKHNDNYYWKKGQTVPCSANGKIVAECDFEVEKILHTNNCISYYCRKTTLLQEKSCLTDGQIYSYLKDNKGYAIHIKNLHIFDEPKELSEYSKRIGDDFQVLGNAPQNMMRCCELKYLIEDYILISIRPEWLCKILNGEKTIEVRKKVLKEMLKNE